MPSAPDAPAIELRGVRKVFRARGRDVVAVDGLDLSVTRGEVFGLLGPNGAGKTTTVEICEGLQRADAGGVCILGLDWAESGSSRAIRARIGVCLQETRFFPRQTVREIVALFRSFYDRGPTVDDAIATVRLQEKADARSAALSGGQRQRLAVACALVGDPDLLFLDEPTTGLDPQARRSLWEVIRAQRDSGRTVLLTTHYMEEAEHLCDRVGVIDHGRLIALGSPAELIRSLGGDHVFEIAATPDTSADEALLVRLRQLATVRKVWRENGRVAIAAGAPHQVLPALLRELEQAGIDLTELRTRHATLEDVFVGLTGRHLRDGEAA